MIPEIRAASSVLPSHTGGNSRSPRSTPRRRRAPGGGVAPGGPGPRGSRFETTARPGVHFATTPGGEVPSARSGSQDIPVWPASWKGRPDGACRAYGGSSRACRAVRARGRRPQEARAGAHRPARGSARASADVPRRGARAQRGRRPPPLRRARVRALPGLRNPGAWLRPGPVRRVQARIPGGVLVQEPRRLPLLQRAPAARPGRAPGRCPLPARVGAAMATLAPALGALAACAGCSSREPSPGDRAAGHLRPLPAPGTTGTLRRGDLHSALWGEPQLEPALPLRRTRRGVRPRRDGRPFRPGAAAHGRGGPQGPPAHRAEAARAAPAETARGPDRRARRGVCRVGPVDADDGPRRSAPAEAVLGLHRGLLAPRRGAPARQRPRGARTPPRLRRPRPDLARAPLYAAGRSHLLPAEAPPD